MLKSPSFLFENQTALGEEITVRHFTNIFEKRTRETSIYPPEAGRKIIDYLPEALRRSRESEQLRVIHNGVVLTPEMARAEEPAPGDELIFYVLPGGLELLAAVIVSVVLAGVSYAVSALTAPSQPSRKDELESSDTYGFDGVANSSRPGQRVPLIYGKHRVGGTLISQFIRKARDDSVGPADPQTGELHTLLGLGAGPIEAVEEIEINGNPIADFQGVEAHVRLGGVYQAPIPGFDDVVIESSKDSQIKQSEPPFNFTMSQAGDGFEITFRFQAGLYRINERGKLKQKEVVLRVRYREQLVSGSSPWSAFEEKKIAAATRNAFDSFYTSPRLARGIYEVEVQRLTPDDSKTSEFSEVTVISTRSVIDDLNFTYPGIALLGVRQLPTNQVSGRPPTYSSIVRGRKVRQYTSLTTFVTQWSDSPAWILLDFLTAREGLGAFFDHDTNIDIQAFIDWDTECDSLVPKEDGGALEKQFRCDIVIDGSMKAIDVIKQICSCGRANFYLKGDKWSVKPDKEEDAVAFFEMSRIGKDSFTVSRKSGQNLANFFVAEFWNEETDYRQDAMPREDPTLQSTDRQIEKKINLLGVSRPSQVNRLLNYMMLSNRLIRRQITMEVGAEAITLEAGDVIIVAHDVMGIGFSGKLKDVISNTEIVLDRPVNVISGKSYELTVIHDSDVIDVVGVTNNPDTDISLISVADSWSEAPKAGLSYSFGEVTKSTVKYRVTSITAGSTPWKRQIKADEYNEAIYGSDLSVLPAPSSTRLPSPGRIPPNVTELKVVERHELESDGSVKAVLDVHFSMPFEGAHTQVFWREEGILIWEEASPPITSGRWTISDNVEAPGATYEISVVSLAAHGNRKHPDLGSRTTITTQGVLSRPGTITGFRVDRTGPGLVFQWDPVDPVTNPDFEFYELRVGSQWETAQLIALTPDTRVETTFVRTGTVTYLIKGVNTSGRYSFIASAVVTNIPGRIGENVVATQTEDPGWTGDIENFEVNSGELELKPVPTALGTTYVLDVTPFGSDLLIGGREGGLTVTGTYTSSIFTVTSGSAVRCLVEVRLEATQADPNLFWSSPTIAGETWGGQFAQETRWAELPDSSAQMIVEMRFSSLTTADADFGPWQRRPPNFEVQLKYAQVRLIVQVIDPAYIIKIQKLEVVYDVPEVFDAGTDTTSAGAAVSVTYNKTYNQEPKLMVSIIGGVEGDTLKITNKSTTGFDVEAFNSGRVVRTIEWSTVGF